MGLEGVARLGDEIERGCPRAGLTSWYSPLTSLARRIPWTASHPLRQRLFTFLFFAAAPTFSFWAWYLLQGRNGIHGDYHDLIFAMPISSLWLTLGPMLMQQGEFNLERLLTFHNTNREAVIGWDVLSIQRAIDRADRWYYRITVPLTLAAAVAVWHASPVISSVVRTQGIATYLAAAIVTISIGFVSASGMWGAFKTVGIAYAATRRPAKTWRPFRSPQSSGIQELYKGCWHTAIIFSVGSVALPTLFVVQDQLPTLARCIVLFFVAILAVGGLVLFTVPIIWLRNSCSAQKDCLINELAVTIEAAQAVVLHSANFSLDELQHRSQVLAMALTLRKEILTQDLIPISTGLARAATTLVLPLLLTILQAAVSNAL